MYHPRHSDLPQPLQHVTPSDVYQAHQYGRKPETRVVHDPYSWKGYVPAVTQTQAPTPAPFPYPAQTQGMSTLPVYQESPASSLSGSEPDYVLPVTPPMNRSPNNNQHHQHQSSPPTPMGGFSNAPIMSAKGDVPENAHRALAGRGIFYIPYSEISSQELNPPCMSKGTCRIFVGQVRREITPGELASLMNSLCSVTVLSVEPRGPGCYSVEVPRNQIQTARLLNGRVLFDYQGVWYARTASEVELLHLHLGTCQAQLKNKALPTSPLVVRR